MTKEERKSYIRRVVSDISHTVLSPKCGDYLSIYTSPVSGKILLNYCEGNCVFTRDLDEVSSKDVTKIYHDLKQDFE